MLAKLWNKLTGWYAHQSRERDLYRGWFYFNKTNEGTPCLNVEVSTQPRPDLGVSFRVSSNDSEIQIQIALGFWMFFSLKNVVPREYFDAWSRFVSGASKQTSEREIGLHLCYADYGDVVLRADIWRDRNQWSAKNPKGWPWNNTGWDACLNLTRTLFGERVRVEYQPEESRIVYVRLPEGKYKAKLKIERVRWVRESVLKLEQRFPLLASEPLYHATVEVPGGIPEPGKGENSWDCGDDAVYAQSQAAQYDYPDRFCSAKSVADSVMRRRHQYGGGYTYEPSDGWPSHLLPHDAPEED